MDIIKHKYIFNFTKKGWLIFISHLNLMRLFERGFLRSELPVTYSQGFNPHLRLALPFPLSLGYVGCSEIGEVYLDQKIKPEEFKEKLNKFLPAEVQITEVQYLNIKNSLAQYVISYDYAIVFKPNFDQPKLAAGLADKSLSLIKTTKSGNVTKMLISDYLTDIKLNGCRLEFSLLVKDQRTLDVGKLLTAWNIPAAEFEDIERLRINCAAF